METLNNFDECVCFKFERIESIRCGRICAARPAPKHENEELIRSPRSLSHTDTHQLSAPRPDSKAQTCAVISHYGCAGTFVNNYRSLTPLQKRSRNRFASICGIFERSPTTKYIFVGNSVFTVKDGEPVFPGLKHGYAS